MKSNARENYLATRPQEAAVEKATLEKAMAEIGDFRKAAIRWGGDGLRLINHARTIGIIINGFLDALPGKQLTTDFWLQFKDKFFDQYGQPVSQAQLVWFANLANKEKAQITDINVALSYRKEILIQVDLILVGEREAGMAQEVNYYDRLLTAMDVKKADQILTGLESDPNYGEMERWPEELKQMVWLQIRPFVERVDELARKLKPVEV